MIRLSDDLAALRRVYPRPLPTMPDVMVIDIAPQYRHQNLSIGRYYGIMVETADEHAELQTFLDQLRPAPVAPYVLDYRPSALTGERITIATYAPPETGWPWIILCHWPATYVARVPAGSNLFARHAYTIEMFDREDLALRGAETLLASIGRDRDVVMTAITADAALAGSA